MLDTTSFLQESALNRRGTLLVSEAHFPAQSQSELWNWRWLDEGLIWK